jgi:MFS family permease
MTAAARTVRRTEIAIVRIAAVAQGLALVCVPTLSSVLTDSRGFALSQTAYGALFVPQSILAVIFSLAGGGLTRRLGMKRMLVMGLAANAVSMALLTSTAALHGAGKPLIFGLLLSATAALGFGFAIVTPALDVLAGAFAPPNATDRAVLIVNALLGAAAALAPVLLTVFVGFGLWWGLPLVAGAAMLLLVAVGSRLPFDVAGRSAAASGTPIPARFWLFAGFALVYGVCEQMLGSWAPMYVTRHLRAPASFGLIALTLYWAFAAACRVIFALAGSVLPPAVVFRVLPFVLAAAFATLAALPGGADPFAAAAAFAIAGLGISALLPLVISFCEESIPEQATAMTSFVFAIYLVGYGLAAFGAGPLQRFVSLPALYGASAVLALAAAGLAFAIVGVLTARPAGTTVGDHQ